VLFNGKEALKAGETILNEIYEDNFFEILPVEPISLRGESEEQTTIIPGFDRAEEKAVKAIQKHSLKIENEQYNRKIDDAYLLLGKARYYDRRFLPALEAFNFLIESRTADIKTFYEGRIWREKTNIRLGNTEMAITNLRSIALNLIPESSFFGPANATIAQAFLNLRELDSALFYIKRSALFEKDKEKRARYLFITAQLFEKKEKPDSAVWAYNQILRLKRKAPRKYNVNAILGKYALLPDSLGIKEKVLLKALDDFENKPFQHSIYRALAKHYEAQKQDSLAKHFFNLSQQSERIDFYTQTSNFKELAEFHLEKGDYVKAGAYYDSLIPLYDFNSIERRRTKRKRETLTEVIEYENVAKETDSLSILLRMSTEERIAFFENHIARKRAAEEKRIDTLKSKGVKLPFFTKSASDFYFYNSMLLLRGKQEFSATWGDRPNVDNWRSAYELIGIEEVSEQDTVAAEQDSRPKEIIVETAESYVKRLPATAQEQDSIEILNHNAYLQLGIIYKEKFKNYDLATKRLTNLLEKDPDPNEAAPAMYHLFKIYEDKDSLIANKYATALLANFPNTVFAKFLSNPENVDAQTYQSPQKLYENALKLYYEEQYLAALEQIETFEVVFSGSAMESKLSLLKAQTKAKLEGVEEWQEALKEVVRKYPQSKEGQYANLLLQGLEETEQLGLFNQEYENYKWIFPFETAQVKEQDSLYAMLDELLKKESKRWYLSKDMYNANYVFVVVHGIRNRAHIEGWKKQDDRLKQEVIKNNNFVTSSSQYREYFKRKSLTQFNK